MYLRFSEAVSILVYIPLNLGLEVNDDFEKMMKEAVVS